MPVIMFWIVVIMTWCVSLGYVIGDAVKECPSGNVCYQVDSSERVDWEAGPEHDAVTFQVTWYDSYEELREDLDLEDGDALSDCYEYSDGKRGCDIYVVRPEFVWGDPRIDDLGHEVLHGFLEGDWHDE